MAAVAEVDPLASVVSPGKEKLLSIGRPVIPLASADEQREARVANASIFLNHPAIVGNDWREQRLFLLAKGLSEDELLEARSRWQEGAAPPWPLQPRTCEIGQRLLNTATTFAGETEFAASRPSLSPARKAARRDKGETGISSSSSSSSSSDSGSDSSGSSDQDDAEQDWWREKQKDLRKVAELSGMRPVESDAINVAVANDMCAATSDSLENECNSKVAVGEEGKKPGKVAKAAKKPGNPQRSKEASSKKSHLNAAGRAEAARAVGLAAKKAFLSQVSDDEALVTPLSPAVTAKSSSGAAAVLPPSPVAAAASPPSAADALARLEARAALERRLFEERLQEAEERESALRRELEEKNKRAAEEEAPASARWETVRGERALDVSTSPPARAAGFAAAAGLAKKKPFGFRFNQNITVVHGSIDVEVDVDSAPTSPEKAAGESMPDLPDDLLELD